MFLSYVTLAVALCLSIIAAYYSIAGLTAIFAAAVIPIIVMGSILELGKVVVTLWLHEYWRQCRFLMKAYLVPAVVVLMFITSMGIFGFLSKAHSDQSLISGDVMSRIAVYDEKIQTERDNIDTARRVLRQMDEAVEQVLSRSTTESGAARSAQIRRSQQAERNRLLREIAQSQKKITALNEERAPIAAEVRKVEAEVGPIKYIAALVYGDTADANLLEAAVRWVIILLVIVFDPLAIMMLLAATESMKWERQRISENLKLAPNDQPDEFQQALNKKKEVARALDSGGDLPPEDTSIHKVEQEKSNIIVEEETNIFEKYPYLSQGFKDYPNLEPVVYKQDDDEHLDLDSVDESDEMKSAMSRWKKDNPGLTLKGQRSALARGEIDQLPWLAYLHNPPEFGFGPEFPVDANKGDIFVKTNSVPHSLNKFNGQKWIKVDKNLSDSYTYNVSYIDYLIEQIAQGNYDTDMLSDSEQQQVTQRLQQNHSSS